MMQKKASAITRTVWWDMDLCQIPPGYDPYQIRPSIESALDKYFDHPGPLTIFAIGNVKSMPRHVLEPISASGIYIKHACYGMIDFIMDMYKWAVHNPPPAIIMVISDGREECFKLLLSDYRDNGYTILRASLNDQGQKPEYASEMWLWNSLLDSGSADTKQVTTRQECIAIGQPTWFCRRCCFAAQSFDDFTTHLEEIKHPQKEYGKPRSAFNMLKKQPEENLQNLVAGQSEKEASLDPQPKDATNGEEATTKG